MHKGFGKCVDKGLIKVSARIWVRLGWVQSGVCIRTWEGFRQGFRQGIKQDSSKDLGKSLSKISSVRYKGYGGYKTSYLRFLCEVFDGCMNFTNLVKIHEFLDIFQCHFCSNLLTCSIYSMLLNRLL